ncbi:DUF2971 domain-containing protein [Roseibium album]|uniref:DUF2971 domain-containing protein n=1 Tax=Roseibium album TaxID=311410 RepID=UPI00248FC98D|nr:DUF2971 domain-containing protein [Roseibium album]
MEKIRRLYYFTKANHAVCNIKRRRLKISFPDQVNDIFEMNPFDFGQDRAARHAWKKLIANVSEKLGFISFSHHWSSPTMWGHYAADHSGVCCGFDIPEPYIKQIQYVPELRPFNSLALTDEEVFDSEAEYARSTKSSHWEYESEWRLPAKLTEQEIKDKLQGKSERFFVPFGGNLRLREVIIGARSDTTSEQIRSALSSEDNVVIKTARPSFRAYKIVEQRDPKLKR